MRLRQLLNCFSSAESIWNANEADLRRAGLPDTPHGNFVRGRDKIDLSAEMAKVVNAGAHVVTLEDELYPALLRPLDDAPMLLYVRGRLAEDDHRALAIVGTRSATRYGRDAAHTLAKQ